MISRHILAVMQIQSIGGGEPLGREVGDVLKIRSGLKRQAWWEDLGGAGRPRLKFLTICFRKEEADRGGILITVLKTYL